MIHKFPYGTKEQNDLITLPPGTLTIDGVNSLRVHNGEQSGGGVLELNKVDIPIPFKGEVYTSDLINGPNLASLVGLTAGTSINPTETWLHFVDPVDNKTKFISKKSRRNVLSWNQLNNLGLLDGSKIVNIRGLDYILRVPKGIVGSSSSDSTGNDTLSTHGSEWNRLMYHISSGYNGLGSEGPNKKWAEYTNEELGMGAGVIGASFFCNEISTVSSNNRICRGLGGVTYFNTAGYNFTHANYGWRPLLELIE